MKKTIKYYIPILLLLISAGMITVSAQYEGENNVRVAMVPSLADNILKRITDAGYNYVQRSFLPGIGDTVEWDNGDYRFFDDDTASHEYFDRIVDEFLDVHSFNRRFGTNLQIIPAIMLGSRFSNNLRYTDLEREIKWEPLTEMVPEKILIYHIDKNHHAPGSKLKGVLGLIFGNMASKDECYKTVSLDDQLSKDKYEKYRCPSYAPDPEGYDKAIRAIFEVIATAFEEAKSQASGSTFPDSVAYVHIGSDEPYLVDLAPVARKHQFLVGQSQIDKEWIANNRNTRGNIERIDIERCSEYDENCFSLKFRAIQEEVIISDTTIDSIYFDTLIVSRLISDTISCVDGDYPVATAYPLDSNGILIIDSANIKLPYNYSLTRNDETRGTTGYIYTGEPDTSQIQALMVCAISRIVDTISNATDVNSTTRPFRNSRVIVYADAFDKYKKGGTFNISGAVPMLMSEHPQCTSRVIFQPYQYDETHRDLGTTTIKGWLCSQWGGISAPNSEEKHYKFKGDFNYALHGNFYHSDSALSFFHDNGFSTMQTYGWAGPSFYSSASIEKFANYFRMARSAISTDRSKNIGYVAVNWKYDEPSWLNGNSDNLYAQNYRYVIYEYAAQLLNPSLCHFSRANSASRNSSFFGNLMPTLNSPIASSFQVDEFTTRRLDYLTVLQNHFYPDLDDSLNLTGQKESVPFYDAITYCNNLSIKENLEPVYTFTGSRLNKTKEINPDLVISDASTVRADYSSNGYRIPTVEELERGIDDTTIIVEGSISEWVWHSTASDPELCAGFYYYNHLTNTEVEASGNIGGISKSFRIVTDIEDTIVITGSGDILQKKAIAKKVILMYDATFESWDNAKYYAGENIYIAKETDIPAGAEIYFKTD